MENRLCHLCSRCKKVKESLPLKKLKQRKSWTKPEDKHKEILGLHFNGCQLWESAGLRDDAMTAEFLLDR